MHRPSYKMQEGSSLFQHPALSHALSCHLKRLDSLQRKHTSSKPPLIVPVSAWPRAIGELQQLIVNAVSLFPTHVTCCWC